MPDYYDEIVEITRADWDKIVTRLVNPLLLCYPESMIGDRQLTVLSQRRCYRCGSFVYTSIEDLARALDLALLHLTQGFCRSQYCVEHDLQSPLVCVACLNADREHVRNAGKRKTK